jgi:hypothetical protein
VILEVWKEGGKIKAFVKILNTIYVKGAFGNIFYWRQEEGKYSKLFSPQKHEVWCGCIFCHRVGLALDVPSPSTNL